MRSAYSTAHAALESCPSSSADTGPQRRQRRQHAEGKTEQRLGRGAPELLTGYGDMEPAATGDLALRRLELAREQAQQSRFARAVWAHQRYPIILVD